MHLNKRQKQFLAIASLAAMFSVSSRINIFGFVSQPYPDTPHGIRAELVVHHKQISSTSEEIGRACLPAAETAEAKLIGEYRDPDSTELFQIWLLRIAQWPILRIHGLDDTNCLLAYDERYNQTIGDDISQQNAQQLSLVLYRYRANKIGGVEALQLELDNNAATLAQYGETGYLATEAFWALEEMGISVPEVFEVYDPENPPVMTRPAKGEV